MSEFLETTVDKFTFKVATDRFYSRDGLWVLQLQHPGSNRIRIGLTDYLQQHSGDATFVTMKPTGTNLRSGDCFVDFETIKVTIELASPVSGTIVAVNDALELNPELVNQSPYEKGWLVDLDVPEWQAVRATLLDANAYFVIMKAEAAEETKKL